MQYYQIYYQKQQMSTDNERWKENQKEIIEIFMGQYEQNRSMDAQRFENSHNNHSKSCLSHNKFRDITDKLTKLEKTLLRKQQKISPNNEQQKTDKYEDLNLLRQKIQQTLKKINQQQATSQLGNIQAKIVALFNKSVSTVIQQNRLLDKLCEIRGESDLIEKQISAIKSQLSITQIESNQRAVLRSLSANVFKQISSKIIEQ